MEPILALPPDQFRAALAELNLPRERADELRRQYRLQNSPMAGLYSLLDRVGQAGEGMEAATFLPVSRPEGVSVADAIRSGEAKFAVPQGLLDAVGGIARAVDAPSAAASGLIPREDMVGEALNVAGVAQLGGAAMPAPRGALRSAALGTADEVMETPAQRVARLLREGRADEVTDDLMAQVDPQEMYRLYAFGETGMDLPMDFESRMARAREMGFDTGTPLYHGTDSSQITAFDPSQGMERLPATFFSDSRDVAQTYGNVGEYFARTDYPADFDFSGGSSAMFNNETLSPGGLVRQVRQAADDAARYGAETETDLAFDLQTAGIDPMYADEIDSVRMRNVVDSFDWGGEPANNLAVFDPRNIRRATARFDPRLSHLANLNAANIDPLTGAAAMGASQQQQDPLASLRAYLAATGGVLGR